VRFVACPDDDEIGHVGRSAVDGFVACRGASNHRDDRDAIVAPEHIVTRLNERTDFGVVDFANDRSVARDERRDREEGLAKSRGPRVRCACVVVLGEFSSGVERRIEIRTSKPLAPRIAPRAHHANVVAPHEDVRHLGRCTR
jgi:hypothetical protein